MDEFTLTLNSPITEEQWDTITDVDLDHTNEITFHTKHGKQVVFVKRKKGKWVEVDDFYNRISGRCSVCGWEAHMYEDDVVGMNFCPNCGARMDGGEQG